MADSKLAKDTKKLLGGSVEESRTKRLEKQQSRYRDRGGLFVPADTNPLLDVLLARGVNGESPTKRRRSEVVSQSRKKGKGKAQATTRKKGARSETRREVTNAATADKITSKSSSPKHRESGVKVAATAKSRAVKQDTASRTDQGSAPVAGPSKSSRPPSTKKSTKGKGLTKSLKRSGGQTSTTKATQREEHEHPRSAADQEVGTESEPKSKARERKTRSGQSKSSGKQTLGGAVRDKPEQRSAMKTGISRTEKTSANDQSRDNARGAPSLVPNVAKTSTQGKVDANARGPRPVALSTRPKRPQDVPDNVVADQSDAVVPSRRKRPKLYVPSDTETDDDDDDRPIVDALKSKRGQVTHLRTVKQFREPAGLVGDGVQGRGDAHDPSTSRAARDRDPPRNSVFKQDSALKSGADPSVGIPDTHAERSLSPELEKTTHSRPGSSSGSGSKSVKGKPAHARPSEEETSKKKAPTARPKRKVEKMATDDAPEPPQPDFIHETEAEDHSRPSKRAKKAVPDITRKQSTGKRRRAAADAEGAKPSDQSSNQEEALRTTSRSLKENRGAKKSAATKPARRPKPRLSMFPTPAVAQESEDEIDFLR